MGAERGKYGSASATLTKVALSPKVSYLVPSYSMPEHCPKARKSESVSSCSQRGFASIPRTCRWKKLSESNHVQTCRASRRRQKDGHTREELFFDACSFKACSHRTRLQAVVSLSHVPRGGSRRPLERSRIMRCSASVRNEASQPLLLTQAQRRNEMEGRDIWRSPKLSARIGPTSSSTPALVNKK